MGCQPNPDSLPSSHGQMGLPDPSPSSPGVSRLYESPYRHCERKTAGREQTRYLFSRNLWAGVATTGQERVTCPASSHARPMLPFPLSMVHMLCLHLLLSPPLLPLWFPLSPFLPLPLSWPMPRLCHPQRDLSVLLGLWRAVSLGWHPHPGKAVWAL